MSSKNDWLHVVITEVDTCKNRLITREVEDINKKHIIEPFNNGGFEEEVYFKWNSENPGFVNSFIGNQYIIDTKNCVKSWCRDESCYIYEPDIDHIKRIGSDNNTKVNDLNFLISVKGEYLKLLDNLFIKAVKTSCDVNATLKEYTKNGFFTDQNHYIIGKGHHLFVVLNSQNKGELRVVMSNHETTFKELQSMYEFFEIVTLEFSELLIEEEIN